MKSLVFALSVACALGLQAKTIYVNCQMDDYTGHDGTKPELAVKTLVEGYDKATANGDSIEVAPGVYNEGLANANHWWGYSRIKLGRKLYIYASGRAEETIIEGSRGEDRVKCISVEGANGAKSIIRGFTLRNGWSDNWYWKNGVLTSSSAACNGGALHSSVNGTSGFLTGPYVVDCVIENCDSSVGGFAVGGTFVRCRIGDVTLAGGYLCNTVQLFNCLVSGVTKLDGTHALATANVSSSKIVNTTFADNVFSILWVAPNTVCNSVFGTDNNGSAGAVTKESTVNDGVNAPQLVSPMTGDVHPRSGSTAASAGDPEYLADLGLPAEGEGSVFNVDPYLDLDHKAIARTGTIAAGAFQTAVTPRYGTLVVTSLMTNETGRLHVKSYLVPDAYPKSYRFGNPFPETTGRVVYYNLISGGTTFNSKLPRDANDEHDFVDVLPPFSPSDPVVKLEMGVRSSVVKWADPNASAAVADGTKDHPYATLQAAMDAVTATGEPGLIIAKAGTYRPGPADEGVVSVDWNSTTGKFMLKTNAKDVRLISESGAGQTFVTGRPDSETKGCGANAVAGFFGGNGLRVQGFTFTGCYGSSDKLTDPNWTTARAVCYSYNSETYYADCVFSNNVGGAYVVAGTLNRCKVIGNTAPLGLFLAGSRAYSCLIANNDVLGCLFPGEFSTDQWVLNCSIAGNGCTSAFADKEKLRVVNTVVADGGATVFAANGHYGCVYDGFTTWNASNYLRANPCFADVKRNDCRMGGMSAGIGYGISLSHANAMGSILYCDRDVDYNLVKVFDDGSLLPGAVANVAHGVYVEKGEIGGLTLSSGDFGQVHELSGSETLTVSVAATTRPVSGVTTNGIPVGFEGLDGQALVLAADSGDVTVAPVYTSTWYCSPEGNDAAAGGYPSAAKTLQGALTAAVSGDTVMAVAGTYRTGEMIQPDVSGKTYTIHSRAVVKKGVTLASESGRDVTVIEGAAATEGVEDETHGLGANAVRGVYLTSGSKVVGFTIRDGHTRKTVGASGTDVHSGPETTGGGVYGEARDTCIVEDCVIQDCAAYRGGNAFAVSLNGCVIERGNATYIGGGLSNGNAYNTLSRNNTKEGYGANGIAYSVQIENCTLLDDLSLAGGSGWVKNTLSKGTVYVNGLLGSQFRNCVFRKGCISGKSQTFDQDSDRVVEIDAAEFGLDEKGGITPTSSDKIVDKADVVLDGAWSNDRDAFGGQRVYNGMRDIGAVEADWRPVYAKDIRRSQLAVEAASPTVKDVDGVVTLKGESSLTAVWANPRQKPGDKCVTMKVTGNGTLTVKLNGETVKEVTSATEDQTFTFENTLAENTLEFGYVPGEGDSGHAEILGAKSFNGMLLLFR